MEIPEPNATDLALVPETEYASCFYADGSPCYGTDGEIPWIRRAVAAEKARDEAQEYRKNREEQLAALKASCVDKCHCPAEYVCEYEDGSRHCLHCEAAKYWAAQERCRTLEAALRDMLRLSHQTDVDEEIRVYEQACAALAPKEG